MWLALYCIIAILALGALGTYLLGRWLRPRHTADWYEN